MSPEPFEVAVIHHRTPALLAQALERLAGIAPRALVRVVDTAFDPSLAVQLDGVHPRLVWLPVPNHSYAAAVNAAARALRQPLLLQMNADVLLGADAIDELRGALDDRRVAVAGPLVRTPSGALQDLGLPYRCHYARLSWRRHAGTPAGGGPASVDVPWLSGCAQLLRREALYAVGGFDARLRFYNEDLEWCLRARRAGWRCRLVATDATHVGGASSQARPALTLEGLRGGYAVTRRHGPAWVRPLHRWGLAASAWTLAQAGPPERRRAWRALARDAARDRLDRSGLGPLLDAPESVC